MTLNSRGAVRKVPPTGLDQIVARAMGTSVDRARIAVLQARSVACLPTAGAGHHRLGDASQTAGAVLDRDRAAVLDVIRRRCRTAIHVT